MKNDSQSQTHIYWKPGTHYPNMRLIEVAESQCTQAWHLIKSIKVQVSEFDFELIKPPNQINQKLFLRAAIHLNQC